MMTHFGVETTFLPDGVHLRQHRHCAQTKIQALDFTDCPDLAQTVAVVAAALGIPVEMTGLESLRIKETDRIAALQTELAKFGGDLRDLRPGPFSGRIDGLCRERPDRWPPTTTTAWPWPLRRWPCAARSPLKSPTVVRKSYPQFWKELAKSGFDLSEAELK